MESEIIQFYVIKPFVVKRVFQLVLNIVERDQYKLTQYYNGVGDPFSFVGTDPVDDGGGVDQGENINKDKAVGF